MQEITGKEAGLAVQEAALGDLAQEQNPAREQGAVGSDLAAGEEKSVGELEAENAEMRASFIPLYTKIGQNFYEKNEGYEFAIAETVKELAELDKKIHTNHLYILRLKGIRYCPNCERIVDDTTVFCGDCGTRIDPLEDVDEGSIRCSCCGAKNSKEKRFCIKCGQKLEEMIRCPHCGVKLPSDARFCEECGTKIL